MNYYPSFSVRSWNNGMRCISFYILTDSGNGLMPSRQQAITWSIMTYRQVSNIRRTVVSNKIIDHSDVVGASPVGTAPTASSFSTEHMASLDWAKTTARRGEGHLSSGIWCVLYKRFYGSLLMCVLSGFVLFIITEGCRIDSLLCHHGWKSCQWDDFKFSIAPGASVNFTQSYHIYKIKKLKITFGNTSIIELKILILCNKGLVM